MKNNFKFVATAVCVALLSVTGVSLANNSIAKITKPVRKTMATGADCYGDPTDICVANVSGEPLYVTIPQLGFYDAPVRSYSGLNVFAGPVIFDTVKVIITDASGEIENRGDGYFPYYPNGYTFNFVPAPHGKVSAMQRIQKSGKRETIMITKK